MEQVYGYIRVSSKDQNEDRQFIALRQFGVPQKNIFLDKQSGKDFNRPQYRALMRPLKAGDVVVIKSIDRLGRNYDEIIEQWRLITKEKLANMIVLDMPLLDTRRKDKDLTGIFIADLVLQILSYVAQTERENIRQRQKEGIAAAKARGVHFGAPKKEISEAALLSLKLKWENGEISARQAARQLNINHKTFLRRISEL